MRVFIASEEHFIQCDDGIYSGTVGGYSFWEHYLNVFDEVVVVARMNQKQTVPAKAMRADGEKVRFFPIPDYTGQWQYLRRWPVLEHNAREVAKQDGAFILRVPGTIGTLLWHWLRRYGKPFAVRVVGDPYDSLGYQSLKSLWSYLIRPMAVCQLKAQCREASAAAYVTQKVLQKRYPPGSYSTTYSDVILGPDTILDDTALTARMTWMEDTQPRSHLWRLCFVGSLARLYKAPDVLIDAVAICMRERVNLELTIVGEGRYRQQLEERAATHGLKERICFLGQLPGGAAVRTQLDAADLFILPSRVEGLPRALIEAMARGLPCIGSTVGGIPELLPAEDLVPHGDAGALAKKIMEVLTSPKRMALMSSRNLKKAKEFCDDILKEKAFAFYQTVKERSEKWGKRQII